MIILQSIDIPDTWNGTVRAMSLPIHFTK